MVPTAAGIASACIEVIELKIIGPDGCRSILGE